MDSVKPRHSVRKDLCNMKVFYKDYLSNNTTSNITYQDFSDVIHTFTDLIKEEIILSNYTFTFSIASINVKVNFRHFENKSPDWGNSNKLKAQIIARGGIPFETIRDENHKIIGNNGGEDWLCYHMQDYYMKVNSFWTYIPTPKGARKKRLFFGTSFWTLNTSRSLKRLLNEYHKKGKIDVEGLKIKQKKNISKDSKTLGSI